MRERLIGRRHRYGIIVLAKIECHGERLEVWEDSKGGFEGMIHTRGDQVSGKRSST